MRFRPRPNGESSAGDARRYVASALAGEEGESLWIPALVAANLLVTRFFVDNGTLDGVNVHLIDVASSIAGSAMFMALRAVRRAFWSPRPPLTIAVWIVSGAAFALGGALPSFVGTGSVGREIAEQVPVGVVAYALLTVIVGIIVVLWRSSRPLLLALSARRQELERRQANLSEDIRQLRGKITEAIAREIQMVAEQTEKLLREDRSDAPLVAAKSLRTAIDEVIRPLSWSLHDPSAAFDIELAQHADQLQEVDRATLRLVSRAPIQLGRVISPVLFAAFAVVFVGATATFLDGVPGLIVALCEVGLAAALLTLLRARWGGIHLPPFAAILLVGLIPTLVGGLALTALPKFGSALSGLVAIAIGMGTSAGGSAAVLRLVGQRVDQVREFEAINARLDRVNTELAQGRWVAQHTLARTVHGQVQAKLLVAALRLEQAEPDREGAEADIRGARAAIDSADEPETVPFRQSIDAMVEAWNGACDVHIESTGELEAVLDQDPVARVCVLEVIREGIANAAKHASAPWVEAQLAIERGSERAGQTVRVVLRSPGGSAQLESSEPGFGTAILADSTEQWSLVQRGDTVELRADIAVSEVRRSPGEHSRG